MLREANIARPKRIAGVYDVCQFQTSTSPCFLLLAVGDVLGSAARRPRRGAGLSARRPRRGAGLSAAAAHHGLLRAACGVTRHLRLRGTRSVRHTPIQGNAG